MWLLRNPSVSFFMVFAAFMDLAIWSRPTWLVNKLASPTAVIDYGHMIGIDLGRFESRVGVIRNNTFEIIVDGQGRSVVPSYVAFTDHGTLVGHEAMDQALSNPKNTIFDIRNLIGRDFTNPELQETIARLPYDVVEKKGKPFVKVRLNDKDTYFTPEDISAMILGKLKNLAETQLKAPIRYAVVWIPSYFNDTQRQATKDAGAIAGLNIQHIVNEPTAAAIALQLDTMGCGSDDNCYEVPACRINFVFCDIREKEIDLTLLQLDRGVFETLSKVRDDFGWATFENQNPSNLEFLPSILQTQFSTSNLQSSEKRLHKSFKQLLVDARLYNKKKVDGIVLIGDTPYATKSQEVLEGYFDDKKVLTRPEFTNDQAIVYGVAVQGNVLASEVQNSGCAGLYMDIAELSIGIETSDRELEILLPRETVIPTRKSRLVSTVTDNQEKMTIKIWEGERQIASKNRLLGILDLARLPRKLKGVLTIEIALEVSANRVLYATARDMEDGVRASFVFKARKSQYTEEVLEGILQDAKTFQEEDSLLLKNPPLVFPDEDEDRKFSLVLK